jgi:hypothetical protein
MRRFMRRYKAGLMPRGAGEVNREAPGAQPPFSHCSQLWRPEARQSCSLR